MTTSVRVKPFTVTSGKYRFKFTPESEGGFSVSCVNVKGINTQGETFEEALRNALSAAAFVEQCVADIEAADASSTGRAGNMNTGETSMERTERMFPGIAKSNPEPPGRFAMT